MNKTTFTGMTIKKVVYQVSVLPLGFPHRRRWGRQATYIRASRPDKLAKESEKQLANLPYNDVLSRLADASDILKGNKGK